MVTMSQVCPVCGKEFEVCADCGALVGHGCPQSETVPCAPEIASRLKECREYNCAANHEGFCAKDDLDLYAQGAVSDPNMKCPDDGVE